MFTRPRRCTGGAMTPLRENVDEVAIRSRQQAGRHLDHGHPGPERGIDAPELQADIPAADDEQRLGDIREIESARRIHHARAVDREPGYRRRPRSGGDDGVVERDRFLPTLHELDGDCLRVDERRAAAHVGDFAELRDLAETADEPLDDGVLVAAQLVEIDLRSGEGHAPCRRLVRLMDDVGDVQQRLRRNAAAIEADAARILLGVDERDLHAEVGGIEGRRVPTRTRTDHH